jgi:hypothetical protein
MPGTSAKSAISPKVVDAKEVFQVPCPRVSHTWLCFLCSVSLCEFEGWWIASSQTDYAAVRHKVDHTYEVSCKSTLSWHHVADLAIKSCLLLSLLQQCSAQYCSAAPCNTAKQQSFCLGRCFWNTIMMPLCYALTWQGLLSSLQSFVELLERKNEMQLADNIQ